MAHTGTGWRVGLWCAVSSVAQAAEDRVSLPEQEAAGRAFAAALDAQVVSVYTVAGHSRADYVFWAEAERDMPAYRQAREDIESGRVNLIHCVDPDRLGRNAALVSQFYSLAERHGAEIYAASAPHQVGQWTTSHRYLPAILGVRAAEYVGQLVHKHRAGMRGRVRRGLHAHKWPLGYEAVKNGSGATTGGRFTDDIGAVDLITRLFLEGRPYSEILRALDASVYTPPQGGDGWDQSTVRYITDNDTYAGLVTWGDAGNDEPSPLFPARWDAETHRAIVRERERRDAATPTRRSGPLLGVAICLTCGQPMWRSANKNRHYLRCRRAECQPNHIREDAALLAVARFVQDLATPEVLDAALDSLQIDRPDPGPELARLADQAADLDAQRRRLALAYAAGKMDADIYYQTDRTLAEQGERIEAQRRELQAEADAVRDPDETRAALLQLVDDLPLILAERPPSTIAAQLHHAGIRVLAEHGSFVVGLAL